MPARGMIPQYAPMIPTQVADPFHRDGWIYEERSTAGASWPTRTAPAFRPCGVALAASFAARSVGSPEQRLTGLHPAAFSDDQAARGRSSYIDMDRRAYGPEDLKALRSGSTDEPACAACQPNWRGIRDWRLAARASERHLAQLRRRRR